MDLDDLSKLPTVDLLDRAVALASESGEDSDQYWAAVTSLRQRPERSVFERAAEWCGSTNAGLRELGADVLAQLGAPNCPFATDSTPLLVGLLHDTDDDVVISALFALSHLRAGPTPELAMFAGHASNSVREAAAYALGGRDEPTALAALQLLTSDTDTDVRNWATFGLGSLCESDSTEIRDALAARLADDDFEIRGEAIVGLARRHDARATEAIAAELAREEVSVLAIEAAELMPSKRFVPRLRALFDSQPDDATLCALQNCEAAIDSPAA